jgi:NTE family protein
MLMQRPSTGDRAVNALDNPNQRDPARPSIGLALGGGAARGFAHMGVVRTLLAHGVKPDVITGTSMGAVIGGCYAAGQLDSFSEWSLTLTRRRIFRYIDVSLSGSGLISGMRLARHLESTLGRTRIETLATRFAAVAAEIDTGHEVWLTRGRLVEAIRASYALPGVFAPVKVGKRWLVDGALVNPVPVSAARALEARMVIAVNLNADLLGRGGTIASHGFEEDEAADEPAPADRHWRERINLDRFVKRQVFGRSGRPGLPTVMIEAYNVMQDRITRARLAGDPPDIMISPRLGSIGWFDFHRAQDAVRIGAEAAERALDMIHEAMEALR